MSLRLAFLQRRVTLFTVSFFTLRDFCDGVVTSASLVPRCLQGSRRTRGLGLYEEGEPFLHPHHVRIPAVPHPPPLTPLTFTAPASPAQPLPQLGLRLQLRARPPLLGRPPKHLRHHHQGSPQQGGFPPELQRRLRRRQRRREGACSRSDAPHRGGQTLPPFGRKVLVRGGGEVGGGGGAGAEGAVVQR